MSASAICGDSDAFSNRFETEINCPISKKLMKIFRKAKRMYIFYYDRSDTEK